MKQITIGKNDSGQRLDRFLGKAFPSLSQGIICRAIRNKRIKVGGKRTETAYRLAEGDQIQLYLNDELLAPPAAPDDFMSADDNLTVVYEDENILLADKAPGLVVHEDEEKTADTLINRIKKYLFVKGEYSPENEQSFAPALCNRIDRNTGGIVIAAKNAEALRILNQKIKDRELDKKYLCVVAGKMQKKEALLTAYLEKNTEKNLVTVTDKKTPANRTIKTRYRVLEETDEMSLLEVDLLTGRTHQIRAHMAYIGHPLLGDGKYGRNQINKQYGYKYQALYSYKLKFAFTSDSGVLQYLSGREFSVQDIWFKDKFYQYKKGWNK